MKETKSILLSEHFADLERVYSSKVLEKLEETAGLDRTFYNKASVLQDPEAFKSTEYIFSTWGMPSLEEKNTSLTMASQTASKVLLSKTTKRSPDLYGQKKLCSACPKCVCRTSLLTRSSTV